jgi:hypothetical protein
VAITDEIFIKITAQTQQTVQSITGLAKQFAAAYLSVEAFKRVVVDSVKEYLQSQEALAKLGNSLKITGQYTDTAVNSITNLAEALQKSTRFSHDQTEVATAMLIQLGGLSAEMAKKTIPLVQDFAEAMGLDLEQAATVVSKSLEGTTNMLGRYGIKIDTTKTGSDRLAEITEQLGKKFGGMAKAVGDSALGSFVKLSSATKDLKEEFGRALVTNLNPFLKWLTNVVQKAAEGYKSLNDLRDAMASISSGTATATQRVVMLNAELLTLQSRSIAAAAGLTNTGNMAGPNAGFKFNYAGGVGAVQSPESSTAHAQMLVAALTMGYKNLAKNQDEAAQKSAALAKAQADAAEAQRLRMEDIGKITTSNLDKATSAWQEYWNSQNDVIKNDYEMIKAQAAIADAQEKINKELTRSKSLGPTATTNEDEMNAMDAKARELANTWGQVANAVETFGSALVKGNAAGAIGGLISQVSGLLTSYALLTAAQAYLRFDYAGVAFWLGIAGVGIVGSVAGAAISSSGSGTLDTLPHYASGTDYVPQTGLAVVHQGERIIPAGGGGGRSMIVNVYGGIWQEDDLARRVFTAASKW